MTAYTIAAENDELFVVDGVIAERPQDGAERLRGAFVMSGLVDCHAHATFDLSDRGIEPGTAEVVRANMRDYRAAGVTALRDAGGISMAAVDAGDPRVVAAGRFLAPEGRYFPTWTIPTEGTALVEAARTQVAAGATWVKVVDDWFSPDSGVVEQHYDVDVLRETATVVHAAGARLAMHCMDTASVEAAIVAGIDSVEHGTNATEDQVRRMAAAEIAWCPTITLIRSFLTGGALPDPAYGERSVRFYTEDLKALLPIAETAGVTILAGSDTLPPAEFWREIATLREYGATPATALAAATGAARRFLGFPELEFGAPADLVLYEANPLDDPEVLASPALVMVDGEVVGRGDPIT